MYVRTNANGTSITVPHNPTIGSFTQTRTQITSTCAQFADRNFGVCMRCGSCPHLG